VKLLPLQTEFAYDLLPCAVLNRRDCLRCPRFTWMNEKALSLV
jgi:hypothetical protein